MDETTSANGGCDPEAIDHLKQEVEHYYRAEFQHEQRANWLMVTAIAVIGLLGDRLTSLWTQLSCLERYLFVFGLGFLGVSALTSILALWPLSGHHGRFAWLRSAQEREVVLPENSMETLTRHVKAHRRRAIVRAKQVIWVLLPFAAGMLLTGLGLLALII